MSVLRAGAAVVTLAALAACGVKAPPRPPEKAAQPAVPEKVEAASCEAGCGGAAPSTSTITSTKKTSP